jgi:fibronectin type 3 domain-containing protein
MYRFSAVILNVALFLQAVSAQERNIALLCSPRPDSILLRWAPVDVETWRLGNRYGYVVLRYTLLKGGRLTEDVVKTVLTPEPRKPAPVELWEPLAESDKYVGIAAECIFFANPEGTGGNPHAVARRYREEQNRFGFALYAADHSLAAARLSGLYMADRSARADEKYLYRVYIAAPDTETPSDTASVFTGAAEYQPLPAPLELNAAWGDKSVELWWNVLYLNHHYNSYVVEKSTDGVSFAPLGGNAVVQASDEGVVAGYAYKTDSLENNRTRYYYRIRGVSAFGETGPPCKAVSGTGRLPIAQAPVIVGNEVIDNRSVRLQWSYPDEMNEYIAGFNIYRSAAPNGVKDKLPQRLGASDRSFVDDAPELTNYYLISVFNDEQELLSAMPAYAELVDSIPPAPPAGLWGTIDSTGRVYLHWARNTEKDILGYRIYKANRPDFEFVLAHPAVVTDAAFVDSVNIKTLDSKAYYKLMAIDLRQNQSAFSELLGLDKPDVIAPVSPVIRGVEAQKKALAVTWVNSSSTDVVRHHVFRQAPGDTAYLPLAVLAQTGEVYASFADKTALAGKTYRYRITAEDHVGLRSAPSKPMAGKMEAHTVESIRLKAQAQTEGIVLKWTVSSDKEALRVLIYRSVDGAPLQLYGNAAGNSYTDREYVPEKSHTYRIKVVYSDESASSLSNPVVVKK